MTRVTLQTIADAVGVSRMTVSSAYSRPAKHHRNCGLGFLLLQMISAMSGRIRRLARWPFCQAHRNKGRSLNRLRPRIESERSTVVQSRGQSAAMPRSQFRYCCATPSVLGPTVTPAARAVRSGSAMAVSTACRSSPGW
jgi:hypothetical protein